MAKKRGSARVHKARTKRKKAGGATGKEAGQQARRKRESRGKSVPPSMKR